MKEERTLKKVGKEYVLEIDNKEANLFQRKTYSKEEMKKNYDAIKTQIQMHLDQIGTVRKQLKAAPTYHPDDEAIKAVVLKVLANQKFDKLDTDLSRMLEELELFKKQRLEIEGIIPELKRK